MPGTRSGRAEQTTDGTVVDSLSTTGRPIADGPSDGRFRSQSNEPASVASCRMDELKGPYLGEREREKRLGSSVSLTFLLGAGVVGTLTFLYMS